MKIEPSEFLPIGNEFQKIFGISFGKFIDMRFLLARKELVFNLLKFTDWLEECYPINFLIILTPRLQNFRSTTAL